MGLHDPKYHTYDIFMVLRNDGKINRDTANVLVYIYIIYIQNALFSGNKLAQWQTLLSALGLVIIYCIIAVSRKNDRYPNGLLY